MRELVARRAGLVAGAAVAVLGVTAAAALVGRPMLDRRHDISKWRAAYDGFAVFPGAVKIGEESYELDSDGRGLGEYGLRRTYRLPARAEAAGVAQFVRTHSPQGWTEVSDATCKRISDGTAETLAAGASNSAVPPAVVGPPTIYLDRRFGVTMVPPAAAGPYGIEGGVSFRLSTGRARSGSRWGRRTWAAAPRASRPDPGSWRTPRGVTPARSRRADLTGRHSLSGSRSVAAASSSAAQPPIRRWVAGQPSDGTG